MIEKFSSSSQLPEEWDKVAGANIALCRENLKLLEEVNPCGQEYFVFSDDSIYAILVKYTLKINIFCYSSLRLYLPISIIGIPCSVAAPGYSLVGECRADVREYVRSLKGAKVILNAAEDLCCLGFTKGNTLPSCVMDIKWSSFDEYLLGLRSHYRYRFKKALKKTEGISAELLSGEFDQRLYNLYEQVYERSAYKLEKLSIDFFRKAKADIAVFVESGKPIAFVQYRVVDSKMLFLFGGLEYSQNQKYNLYQNMLLFLVKAAIEAGCTSLDLGQTAEEIKCKLGASLKEKQLYVHHSNRLINWLVTRFIGVLSYSNKDIELKVFKD